VVVKPTTDGGQPPEDVAVSPPASVTETGRSVEKPVSDTPSAPGLTGTTPDTGAEPPTETDAGKTAATGAEAPATDAAPPTTSAAEPAVASTGGAATGPAQAEGTPPPSGLTRIAAFGGIAVALLGAIGFSVMVLLKGRPASAFYVSRPEVEKGFWPLTETNLAQFKFVSYRYGTAEDARKALLRLSFVQEAKPGGRLVSPLAVHFGYYQEDEEKFVAFVGGTELSYSMWREAVSQLSRIEGTIEHRISAAPERRTRVPDPMSLSGSARDIKLLDETDGAGDDYAHYCRYQGPDKASAVAFLKKVVIKDNGEHVVVQTPEGHWARDLRGIYRE
jgi:hypothetical protein